MTETVKKTTTRKPKATTAVKAAKAPVTTAAAVSEPKAKKSNLTVMQAPQAAAAHVQPSPEQIRALAHKYWAERGYQHGNDAEDWFRAEQELRSKAS